MSATLVRDLKLGTPVIRTVDGVALTEGSSDVALGAIRYNAEQDLTPQQKAQARRNLGVEGSGSFLGEFRTWTDVPETIDPFPDGKTPVANDYITVVDVSDYKSDSSIETVGVVYADIEDAELGVTTKYIVEHLLIGRTLAAPVVVGDTTLAKGTTLTRDNVLAIGAAEIDSLTLYEQRSGKWFLVYSGTNNEQYGKDKWSWRYQLNNDIDLAAMIMELTATVSGNIAAIGEERTRAESAENGIERRSVKSVNGYRSDSGTIRIPRTKVYSTCPDTETEHRVVPGGFLENDGWFNLTTKRLYMLCKVGDFYKWIEQCPATSLEGCVRTDVEQELTEQQKKQARDNIGTGPGWTFSGEHEITYDEGYGYVVQRGFSYTSELARVVAEIRVGDEDSFEFVIKNTSAASAEWTFAIKNSYIQIENGSIFFESATKTVLSNHVMEVRVRKVGVRDDLPMFFLSF